jgi:CRISPR-associated protein Csm1
MNKEILQAISIAGMLHDLGKFAERAYALEPGDQDIIQQEYRYGHAFYTEQALRMIFPDAQLNRSLEGKKEYTILNFASRHHKPRNVYELIVAEADRISSGHERAGGDAISDYDTGGRERKSKTPLTSIMARIKLSKDTKNQLSDWRYKIVPEGVAYSGADSQQIFPVTQSKYKPADVQTDYHQQWSRFVSSVRVEKSLGLDLFSNFPTVLAACRSFQWCLPASTRKEEMPDVSLFDHQKATAALASCLYWYHDELNSLEDQAVSVRSIKKFLLFCGDISGIQNFIYQISSKGAYKTLKGRSFFVQLLSEIIAREIITHFGFTETNVLYANGGKFYIILPNTPGVIEELEILKNKINGQLLAEYSGDLYVRFGGEPLSAEDLTRQSGRTLSQIWDELTRKLVSQDRKKYAALVTENYDSLFKIGHGDLATCQVCHCTMQSALRTCSTCSSMEDLGRLLGSTSHIVMSKEVQPKLGRYATRFMDWHVYLVDGFKNGFSGTDVLVFALNDPDFTDIALRFQSPDTTVNSLPYLAGSTHRFDRTFDEIAKMAKGVERLGLLRMDVDNLGKIFSEGLQNYQHGIIKDGSRFHSLGRITTLSWQLNLFFSGILPMLVKSKSDWKERVSVVYAGGDDIFLLGAWDALPEIAHEIYCQFKEFTCQNISFSLSGGMVLTGGKYPIYKSAELAGEAENQAKMHETIFAGKEKVRKSTFTFLDTPMHWLEFRRLFDAYSQLSQIVQRKENYPLLRRLQDIAKSWAESRDKLLRENNGVSLETIKEQIEAEKWRWRMVYSLHRFAKDKKELKKEIEEIQQFVTTSVAGTNRKGIELLGVLSRWCELRMRKEQNKEAV